MNLKQKRYFKPIVLTLIFAFVMAAFLNVSAVNAAGIIKIAVSSSTPKIGDKLKVDVEGTESGDRIEVKFSGILKFESSSANHIVNGNSITFEGGKTTLTFTCQQAGSADIICKGTKNTASSVKVNVNDGSVKQDEAPSNNTDKVKAQYKISDKEYIISERFTEAELPANFKTKKLRLFNYDYKVGTNGKVTLIYLKTTDNIAGKGTFFVYDENKNEPLPLTMLTNDKEYVIVLEPSNLPLKSMVKTDLKVSDKTVDGYQIKGESNGYFFGVNEKAEENWYRLTSDGKYETVDSSYFEGLSEDEGKTPASETENVKVEKKNFFQKAIDFVKTLPDNPRHMLLVLIPVFILLVIVFICTLVSKKDDDENVFEDEEEEDEDEDEELDLTRDENFVPTVESEFMSQPMEETSEDEGEEAEEDEEDEDEDEEEVKKPGFFARRRKKKEDEDDWKKLSEMDLSDFTSSLKESVREIQEEQEVKAAPKKVEKPESSKKKLDFMDLNDL